MLRNTWPLSYMKRRAASYVWVPEPDVSNHVLNIQTGAWSNYTFRQAIREDQIDGTGNYVRFSLRGGTTEGLTVNKCYIGIRSGTSGVNFTTTPTQVTFNGGSTSAVIPANTTLMSDPIPLVVAAGDGLVISIYVPSGATSADNFGSKDTAALGTQFVSRYKAGDDATTLTESGYTGTGPTCLVIDDLELSN